MMHYALLAALPIVMALLQVELACGWNERHKHVLHGMQPHKPLCKSDMLMWKVGGVYV